MMYYGLINSMNRSVVSSFLLDTYSGASVAYSLRKLSSTYSGNCIRVRRSSDNAEQDFGFVSNALDTASLLTFVGVGSGYVVTMYDQSGNLKNVTQASASSQPLIVESGVLVTQVGKPSVKYIVNQNLRATTAIGGFTNYSFFTVYSKTTTSNCVVLGKDDYNFLWLDYNADQRLGAYTVTQTLATNTLQLIGANCNASISNISFYVNNSVTDTISGNAGSVDFQSLGYSGYNTGQTKYLSEVIIYPISQTSNTSNINTNINNHYAIY